MQVCALLIYCGQVEGEIDKLAMEEAGFLNCVSVPDGAPCRVSDKDVPTPDKVWSCLTFLPFLPMSLLKYLFQMA